MRLACLAAHFLRFPTFLVLFAPGSWYSGKQADNMPAKKHILLWTYPARKLWYYGSVLSFAPRLFGFMIVFRMFSSSQSGNGAR